MKSLTTPVSANSNTGLSLPKGDLNPPRKWRTVSGFEEKVSCSPTGLIIPNSNSFTRTFKYLDHPPPKGYLVVMFQKFEVIIQTMCTWTRTESSIFLWDLRALR